MMRLEILFLLGCISATYVSASELCNNKPDEPYCTGQFGLCASPLLGVANAMQIKCPALCDSCVTSSSTTETSTTGTTTTATETTVTVTTATTTTTPQNCFGVEDSPYCNDFLEEQCSSKIYGTELKHRCTILCNTCTSSTSSSTTITTSTTTKITVTETTNTATTRTTTSRTTRTFTSKTTTTKTRTTVTTFGCNGASSLLKSASLCGLYT